MLTCNGRVLLLSLFTVISVRAEMYSAIAEMEQLLDTESVLITNLESYVGAQEDKLTVLKR